MSGKSEFGEVAGKIAGEVAAGLVKKAAPAVKKAAKAVEDKVDDVISKPAPKKAPKKTTTTQRRVGRELNDGEQLLDPEEFVKRYKVGHPYTEDSWGGSKTWDDLTDNDSFWEGPDVVTDKYHGGDMTSLGENIKKVGMQKPVTVDSKTGEVLDGHHRVIAARDWGVPVLYKIKKVGE